MNNCCMDEKCIQCCRGTQMLLSHEDIMRIESLGFSTEFFVTESGGWLQLKNDSGQCVFHNGVGCSIYEKRPEGCKLYPIVYNSDMNCAILDDDCPHREKFEISKIALQQVSDLAIRLEYERNQRK